MNNKMKNALKKFSEIKKKDKNVLGILVSGSVIHSVPDKNSDIDVYIITKESKTRMRGNTWINGVEIEYFENPVKQIRKYFATELETGKHTAHMFANSEIVFKKDKVIDDLIDEAKKIMNQKLPKLNETKIEMFKYAIDDMKKDLEDVYLKKDNFTFELVATDIIKESIKIFCAVKRINVEKSKRLEEYLKKENSIFSRILSEAILEKNIEKRFKSINNLIKYVEKLLGGKRTKEWKLVSDCTC